MVGKLWDLSKVPLNTDVPEVPEVWTALNATLILLLELHLAVLWNQRYTCTAADVSHNYLQEPEARLWQNEPRCGRCHQVMGGTGAWEGSVKMDRQLAGKSWITWEIWNIPYFLIPSKETVLTERRLLKTLNWSLKKKLFLLLKLMLCCHYSQNSICSYNDFINFTWYPSEVNKGRDERRGCSQKPREQTREPSAPPCHHRWCRCPWSELG